MLADAHPCRPTIISDRNRSGILIALLVAEQFRLIGAID
jgi:hypothetical protein